RKSRKEIASSEYNRIQREVKKVIKGALKLEKEDKPWKKWAKKQIYKIEGASDSDLAEVYDVLMK
ncbi:MAG: hypothetical protein PHG66_00680, partial [Candidatus Colwellbacteria bacterium]|nr:hypothetical protein [Candidatus Colwellbacteria bacterium]